MTTQMAPSPTTERAAAGEARVRRRRLVLLIGKLIVLVLYLVFLAYAVILGIAFFLRLFGANADASFADWIYRASARIMEPFRGIFPTTQLSERSEFDASLLFAMVVYLVVAVGLHGMVHWFTRRISRVDDERDRRRYWSTLAAATPATVAAPAPAPVSAAPVVAPLPASDLPTRTPTYESQPPLAARQDQPTVGSETTMSAPASPFPSVPSSDDAPSGQLGRVNPPVSPFPATEQLRTERSTYRR